MLQVVENPERHFSCKGIPRSEWQGLKERTHQSSSLSELFCAKILSLSGLCEFFVFADDQTCIYLFAQNFKHFIEFYNEIHKYISVDSTVKKKIEGKLSGMKIVMSGFRDKDLEQLIENNGGEISSGVSKNTNILIIKDDTVMNTSKVVKAKDLGVKIYTIQEFNKIMK
jgi:NAD-dependent DNA ligase